MRRIFACLLLVLSGIAVAEELPLWEAGVGVASLVHPDYRGARHRNYRAFPVPYLIYRGEKLQMRRDGLRLQLFGLDRVSLGISATASFPGNEDSSSSPRSGMPALDPTFELGPSLDVALGQWSPDWRLSFRAPLRAVMATDLRHFQNAGWLANPQFTARNHRQVRGWSVGGSYSLGVLWGSEAYHRYFYEVAPEFATPQRPAYHADGGYSGARLSLSISARRGPLRLGLGLVHDRLEGVAYADSPLMETEAATVIGLGFAYELGRSRRPAGGSNTMQENASHGSQ